MTSVVFHFEDWTQHVGASEPKSTLHRWFQSCKALGVNRVVMIDCTQFQIGQYYSHRDSEIDFVRFSSLEDFETGYQGQMVYVDKIYDSSRNLVSTELVDYSHPQGDVAYVFGRDSAHIERTPERNQHDWVHFDTPNDYAVYAEAAMNIVMWHRSKTWQ